MCGLRRGMWGTLLQLQMAGCCSICWAPLGRWGGLLKLRSSRLSVSILPVVACHALGCECQAPACPRCVARHCSA